MALAGTSGSSPLPEGILTHLAATPEVLVKEVLVAAAIELYREGRITQGQGAQFAGISRAEFLDELFRAKVPACQVTVDELMEEVDRAVEGAIVNASPLILLTKVGRPDLLPWTASTSLFRIPWSQRLRACTRRTSDSRMGRASNPRGEAHRDRPGARGGPHAATRRSTPPYTPLVHPFRTRGRACPVRARGRPRGTSRGRGRRASPNRCA